MSRFASLLGLIVFLGGGFQTYATEPKAQADVTDPLAKVYPVLQEATAKLSSVAVLNVESNGTTEDVSGVQLALINSLAKQPDLLLISPDDVRKTVGVEFETSPAALAAVAKKCSAQAVLYPQIIQSNKELELTLLLVGDNAAILLDRAFALQSLPSPAERASAPQQNPPTLPPPPPPPPAGPPPRLHHPTPRPRGSLSRRSRSRCATE